VQVSVSPTAAVSGITAGIADTLGAEIATPASRAASISLEKSLIARPPSLNHGKIRVLNRPRTAGVAHIGERKHPSSIAVMNNGPIL
jgi:hypothetical protein